MCRTRSAVVRSRVGIVTTWRPSRKTVARSHSANTSSRRWLTNRTDTPRSRSRRTIVNRRSTSCADSDAVGSSRMRTRASSERDLAISMSCWSAIERPRTGAPTSTCTSSSRNRPSARRRVAPQSMEPRRPDGACPMNTFSATVRSGKRRGSWCTTAIPSEREWAGPWIWVASPSSPIVPLSGWWTPARILTSVLFPAPFSPTSPWISPGRRSRDTSSRACVAAKRLEIPRSSTRGGTDGPAGSDPATWAATACVTRSHLQRASHRSGRPGRRPRRPRCPSRAAQRPSPGGPQRR